MKKMEQGGAKTRGQRTEQKQHRSSFSDKMFYKCGRCQSTYYESGHSMRDVCRCRNCGAENHPERKGRRKLIGNFYKIFRLLMDFSL